MLEGKAEGYDWSSVGLGRNGEPVEQWRGETAGEEAVLDEDVGEA